MPDYIFTTREEITEIIKSAIEETLPPKAPKNSDIDTMNLPAALELLQEHGYKLSKCSLYRLTAMDLIPYMKLGGRLVFSRRELIDWLKNLLQQKRTKDELLVNMQNRIRKKR